MSQPPTAAAQESVRPTRASRTPWIVLGVAVIVAIAVLGYVFRGSFIKPDKSLSGYQAVFLTNGQVYFGKMGRGDSSYVTLTDIFYLQVNQPLQSGQQTAAQQAAATAAAAANPQLSLVKLGNELHGPQDLMHISRSQILFYENMEASGKVAQAIEAYKASNASASGTPAAAGAASGAAGAASSASGSQLQNPAAAGAGAAGSVPVAPAAPATGSGVGGAQPTK
jgi:hypothetical protein